jgi:hypothetical protein
MANIQLNWRKVLNCEYEHAEWEANGKWFACAKWNKGELVTSTSSAFADWASAFEAGLNLAVSLSAHYATAQAIK